MGQEMTDVLKLAQLEFKIMGINNFNPRIIKSRKWLNWITNFSQSTCKVCASKNGQIYDKNNLPDEQPPVHPYCRCLIDTLFSILAGTATIDGKNGADYWIKNFKALPSYYLSKEEAQNNGWKSYIGNLKKVCSGKSIGGDLYFNREGKLPSSLGRIWYEADINYMGGYRNAHRLLYSNDGLIFVTYDHYESFYEII